MKNNNELQKTYSDLIKCKNEVIKDELIKGKDVGLTPVNSPKNLHDYRVKVEKDINNNINEPIKILCSSMRFFERERKSWLEIIDNAKQHIIFELALTKHENFRKNYIQKSFLEDLNKELEVIAIKGPLRITIVITEHNIWFQSLQNILSHFLRRLKGFSKSEISVLNLKRGNPFTLELEELILSYYAYKTNNKKRYRLKTFQKGNEVIKEFEAGIDKREKSEVKVSMDENKEILKEDKYQTEIQKQINLIDDVLKKCIKIKSSLISGAKEDASFSADKFDEKDTNYSHKVSKKTLEFIEEVEEELNKDKTAEEQQKSKIPKEIEVDFFKGKGRYYIKNADNEKNPIRNNQYFLLIEELLNYGMIHWVSGFVLFKKWRDDVLSERPNIQFWSPVGYFNTKIAKCQLIKKSEDEGCWELNPDINITKSTIADANNICEEIEKKSKKDEEDIKQIQEALKLYQKSIKAGKLLIDILIESTNFLTEENKYLVKDVIGIFGKRIQAIDGAIKSIESKKYMKKWDEEWSSLWSDCKVQLGKMAHELMELKRYEHLACKLLYDDKVLSEEEADCLTIIKWMRDIKIGQSKDENYYTEYEELLKSPIIQECLREGTKFALNEMRGKKDTDKEYKRLGKDAQVALWYIIINEKNSFIYQGVEEFKKYFKNAIKEKVLDLQDEKQEEEFLPFDDAKFHPKN